MNKTINRLFSGVLAAVMAVGMLPAYAELDVGADVDVVDNKGTSQAAVIDSAPAQFNVIVPTKLPFAILANNETLKATNAAIKNQGNGPVVLSGITAEGKGWAFGDYDNVDFTKMPMNSKVFTMQLNGDKVPEAAVDTQVNVPITQSAWASGAEGSIYGKTDLPISYDGKFAPQADANEEAVVAHVVFTIGWQTVDGEPSAPVKQLVDWTAEQASEYYTYSVADNHVRVTGLSESGKTKESITEMPDSIDGVPVTSIGERAFQGCTKLALTSLPDGVTDISSNAFNGCTKLALTSLPEGLNWIWPSTFQDCTNLALTSLPDGLIGIGAHAFYRCSNLALTSLPDGVTSIGEGAFFSCTNLALTSLPEGVTSISSNAFYDCTNLALTSLPDGITSIGGTAFYRCSNLALTSLPDGVTSIEYSTFDGCTNLALTSLPTGLTSIEYYAFRDCTNLALTSLPDGVTSIGNGAFWGCTNVNIQMVPCSYSNNAFRGTQCENPTVK